jgi:hypothetical protein
MSQAPGKRLGDRPDPPGDETGSDADAPLDRPVEQGGDTEDDAGRDHQQPDRYQPL